MGLRTCYRQRLKEGWNLRSRGIRLSGRDSGRRWWCGKPNGGQALWNLVGQGKDCDDTLSELGSHCEVLSRETYYDYILTQLTSVVRTDHRRERKDISKDVVIIHKATTATESQSVFLSVSPTILNSV